MNRAEQVLNFCTAARNAHAEMEHVFLYGGCFHFAYMLMSAWPDAKVYYNMDHAITKIGDKFYDITGEVACTNHIPVENYGIEMHRNILSQVGYTQPLNRST